MSTPSHTLLGLKSARQSKSIKDRQASDRHRDCLVLILSFLRQYGYIQTASQLQNEGGSILSRFETADNIDLIQIVTEYEDFCEIRFKRKPKLSRPTQNSKSDLRCHHGRNATASIECSTFRDKAMNKNRNPEVSTNRSKQLLPNRLPLSNRMNNFCSGDVLAIESDAKKVVGDDDTEKELTLKVKGLDSKKSDFQQITQASHRKNSSMQQQSLEERVIKPLPSFGDNTELRALAANIQNEILDKSPGVSWNDVVALDDAKRLLKEAVILPIQYPDLFSGLLVPWRGILLYGPPGTGKTLLAKAVATESETTFFNISASSIVSKFRGESEKLIKVLFDLARYHAPSTVFIDEIDSIMGQRGICGTGGEGGEHEGSRRMKTELLIEMDGLGKESQHVFVLAASNMPWDLDPALLRRLEKRIFVSMPGQVARKMLLQNYLSLHQSELEDEDFEKLAFETDGYNGADIKVLCKEVAMSKVRKIFNKLEVLRNNANHGSKGQDVQKMLERDPITSSDLKKSLETTKPSTDPKLIKRYNEWSDFHGAI